MAIDLKKITCTFLFYPKIARNGTQNRKGDFSNDRNRKKTKVERKALKVRQAQTEYREAVREQKKQERKAQDRHKYMIGGCVLKYFPEGINAFDFNKQEINRIIA